MAKKIDVIVRPMDLNTDPSVKVFSVTVDNKTAVWMETYASLAEVSAFMRGMRALVSMADLDFDFVDFQMKDSESFEVTKRSG